MSQGEDDNFILQPCSICSRTFRSEILPRHEKVCEKSQTKKRKVFDSFKSRVQGTELEEFLGPAPLPGQPIRLTPKVSQTKLPIKTASLPKWKQAHEQLIATVRAARAPDSAPPNVPSITAAGDQCPTCARHFGPRAFDRHVEFCREVASRKPKTPVKQTVAQERLEARTKYRAPLSKGKSPSQKLSAVASEPSPAVASSHLPATKSRSVSSATAPRISASRKISAPASLAPIATRSASATTYSSPGSFTRQGSIRGSLRVRNPSPSKTPLMTRRATSPIKSSISTQQPKIKASLTDMSNNLRPRQKQVDAKQEQLPGLNAIEEAANKQLRALLSWSSNSDLSVQSKPVHPRASPPASTLPSVHPSTPNKFTSSPILASPTSAFSPVPSSNNNTYDFNTTTDSNSNELWPGNKDLSPPPRGNYFNELCRDDSFATLERDIMCSTPKTVRKEKSELPDIYDNYPSVDDPCRRNSIISLSSLRSDGTLADEGVLWSNLEGMQSPIKKSKKKLFARSKTVFEDRNRMLFAQTYDRSASSSDEDEEDGRGSRPIYDEDARRRVAREAVAAAGFDSAYSSLTRRSPRTQSRLEADRKVSKFCHECGAKFPVLIAKFCCECGVRRLLI